MHLHSWKLTCYWVKAWIKTHETPNPLITGDVFIHFGILNKISQITWLKTKLPALVLMMGFTEIMGWQIVQDGCNSYRYWPYSYSSPHILFGCPHTFRTVLLLGNKRIHCSYGRQFHSASGFATSLLKESSGVNHLQYLMHVKGKKKKTSIKMLSFTS